MLWRLHVRYLGVELMVYVVDRGGTWVYPSASCQWLVSNSSEERYICNCRLAAEPI